MEPLFSFLAFSACTCAPLIPRLRGRQPNSDLSQWLGLHVRKFLEFVVGLGTARCVGPPVAQPLLCAYFLPRGHCLPHSCVEQRGFCRPTRSSGARELGLGNYQGPSGGMPSGRRREHSRARICHTGLRWRGSERHFKEPISCESQALADDRQSNLVTMVHLLRFLSFTGTPKTFC